MHSVQVAHDKGLCRKNQKECKNNHWPHKSWQITYPIEAIHLTHTYDNLGCAILGVNVPMWLLSRCGVYKLTIDTSDFTLKVASVAESSHVCNWSILDCLPCLLLCIQLAWSMNWALVCFHSYIYTQFFVKSKNRMQYFSDKYTVYTGTSKMAPCE